MVKHADLYKEAIFVGATLVPVWYVVAAATTFMNIQPSFKNAMDVALTGVVYHLTAEGTGLNAYYLKNSYAAQTSDATYQRDDLVDWHRIRLYDTYQCPFPSPAVYSFR